MMTITKKKGSVHRWSISEGTCHMWVGFVASSETQGQIKGARESLNGRKNMARRKVKNGEKSPWRRPLELVW